MRDSELATVARMKIIPGSHRDDISDAAIGHPFWYPSEAIVRFARHGNEDRPMTKQRMYNTKFRGLDLLPGVNVKVKDHKIAHYRTIEFGDVTNNVFAVTATIELTRFVTFDNHNACAGCGDSAPIPSNDDHDSLWFIIENCGSRLLSPRHEDCHDQVDAWPVPGWRMIGGELFCAECAVEVKKTREALQLKLRAKI